jgi:hypothetical protein
VNPLERAHASAIRANDRLDRLFDRIGTVKNPKGVIVSAFRNSRRAMATTYRNGKWDVAAAADVLDNLEQMVSDRSHLLILRGREVGIDTAREQLHAYDLSPNVSDATTVMRPALRVVAATVQRQTAQALALIDTGASVEQVLGGEGEWGMFSPAPTAQEVSAWSAREAMGALSGMMEGGAVGTGQVFMKQAIAALDAVTTDTCLEINGVIVGLDEDFHLTAEPRYADDMDWPPFHWWCRTVVALYQEQYDLGVTERLLSESAERLSE